MPLKGIITLYSSLLSVQYTTVLHASRSVTWREIHLGKKKCARPNCAAFPNWRSRDTERTEVAILNDRKGRKTTFQYYFHYSDASLSVCAVTSVVYSSGDKDTDSYISKSSHALTSTYFFSRRSLTAVIVNKLLKLVTFDESTKPL